MENSVNNEKLSLTVVGGEQKDSDGDSCCGKNEVGIEPIESVGTADCWTSSFDKDEVDDNGVKDNAGIEDGGTTDDGEIKVGGEIVNHAKAVPKSLQKCQKGCWVTRKPPELAVATTADNVITATLHCELCGDWFERRIELRHHVQLKHGGATASLKSLTHRCPYCHKTFSHSVNVKAHMRTHTGERPYTCAECGRAFYVMSHLKRHMMVHSGEQPFQCMVCLHRFTQLGNLKKHAMCHLREGGRQHTKSIGPDGKHGAELLPSVAHKTAAGSNAQEATLLNDGTETAVAVPGGDGSFRVLVAGATKTMPHCTDIDDAAGSGVEAVDKSMEKEHTKSDNMPRNTCNVCGKHFAIACSLVMHMQTHNNEGPFACSECGSTFSLSAHLKRHMCTHSGDKPYVCMYCGCCFAQSTNLSVHLEQHRGDGMVANVSAPALHSSDKPFECMHCGHHFMHSSSLTSHLKQHCTAAKVVVDASEGSAEQIDMKQQHQADIAGAATGLEVEAGNRATQTTRKRTTHTKAPAVCGVCGKQFTIHSNLVAHMRTHSGEKPFACYECSRAFSVSSHLKRHMRTHSGDKPYACMYCGRCFAQSSNLNVHLKQHRGDGTAANIFAPALHECLDCGRMFTNASGLKVHFKVAHGQLGTAQHGCAKCSLWFPDVAALAAHERSHTELRSYQCVTCGSNFDEPRLLTAHARKEHGPVKQRHMCSQCKKTFTCTEKLAMHERVHGGCTARRASSKASTCQNQERRNAASVELSSTTYDQEFHDMLSSIAGEPEQVVTASTAAGDGDVKKQRGRQRNILKAESTVMANGDVKKRRGRRRSNTKAESISVVAAPASIKVYPVSAPEDKRVVSWLAEVDEEAESQKETNGEVQVKTEVEMKMTAVIEPQRIDRLADASSALIDESIDQLISC